MAEIEQDQRAFARERLTVSNTNKALTVATYEDASNYGTTNHVKAKTAKIVVEGAESIYLDEMGGTPSASRGITLVPGQIHIVRGIEGMRKINMQRAGASDASVEVVYYR